MPTSLRTAYRERLAQGEIRPDAAQAAAVDALSRLEADLDSAGEPGFSLFGRKPKSQRGVYLWGPVGRGKSMLMDLFFESRRSLEAADALPCLHGRGPRPHRRVAQGFDAAERKAQVRPA
jgi:cell division protein ZapE